MWRLFSKKIVLALVIVTATALLLPHAAFAADANESGGSLLGGLVSFADDFLLAPLTFLFESAILPAAAGMMALAGLIMDTAISFSINTSYIFALSPAVNLGWVIVRDIANLFFIFILIYISFGTIVRGTSFGTKRLLAQLVIAAMLVNFSMFFTKAIIDVSNMFGSWLYGGVQSTLQANTARDSEKTVSLSALIADRLGVMTWWTAAQSSDAASKGLFRLFEGNFSFTSAMVRLVIILITAYMFGYVALLFIARAVELLILLVFAPIGFVGGLLPQTAKYSKDWWHELGNVSTFPIAFLLMLYITLQFINSFGLLEKALPQSSVQIAGINVMTYFQYFIIIFLLQASLKVAKDNAGKVGDLAGGLAVGLGKLAVNAGVTFGTGGAALALRSAVAAGFAMKDAKPGEGMKDARGAAWKTFRSALPILNNAKPLKETIKGIVKDGSYDVRNLPLGGKASIGSILSDATGVDVKAKSAKDIKKEKEDFEKEYKVEQDIEAILKNIEAIERARVAGDQAAIDAARGEIKKKTSKMSNKDLETATSRVNGVVQDIAHKRNPADKDEYDEFANETLSHFTDQLKQQQINSIMSGEASGRIKNAVQSARHSDLKLALTPGTPLPNGVASRDEWIKKAFAKLSPAEVAKLDIDKDTDPLQNEQLMELFRPDHLKKVMEEYTYDQRTPIRNSILNLGLGSDKTRDWLENNNEGRSF